MKTNLTTRVTAAVTSACLTFVILSGIALLAEVDYAHADQQIAQSANTAG